VEQSVGSVSACVSVCVCVCVSGRQFLNELILDADILPGGSFRVCQNDLYRVETFDPI